ncbi:MAG: anthranilate phosphoribosyltransferase [bacterium]
MEIVYKNLFNRLLEQKNLSQQEAEGLLEQIIAGDFTPAQIGGLLVALRMKGETAEEVAGFAASLRRHAVAVPDISDEVFDTCGTGGDGMQSFNISTATALVVAACGVKVAKHGNRSVSSTCGSADVLEALGINITLTPEQASRCLRDAGVVFLFAPFYHPAFAKVGSVRKELGVRTIFNILGPLVNPARPQRQIIGVADPSKLKVVAEALKLLDSERTMVMRSKDGHDELTTTAPAEVYEVRRAEIKHYELEPKEFGFNRARQEDLKGGSREENAAIIRAVIAGEKGPRLDTVLLNAGAALYTAGKASDIGKGIEMARSVIEKGEAVKLLDGFVEVSNKSHRSYKSV